MAVVVQMKPEAGADTPRAAVADLLELARSRNADDRQRLLLGVAALCDSTPPSARMNPVLSEIFLALARQAERDIRLVLSERLAGADWAPPALINMLALDEIEIARPVITASPLLQDTDLIRVLVEATLEHQIAVARRPHLSGGVVDAILDRGDAVTMTALASNRTAEISDAGMRRLVEHSQRIAGLRAPLTRHPRLSEAMAEQLYQWVGQALRQSIGERFRIDDARLAPMIAAAAQTAARQATWQGGDSAPPEERQEMERRLVDKLQTAGQLRPGLLIRALRERRLGLFEQGLGALGGFTQAQVRAAIRARDPGALYLACMAVGVDRAVFSSLLIEVRELTGGLPGHNEWVAANISPATAARAFRHWSVEPATPGA